MSDGYLFEAGTEAASAVLAKKLMVEEVAEAVIDAAYLDAAAALVAAELIVEADKEAAAGSIERAMNKGGE